MSTFNLSTIMDAIANTAKAANIVTTAFPYPPASIAGQCLVVGYPEDISFDVTFRGGSHKLTIPVWYIVGRGIDKSSRDALSAIISGVKGTKEALDGNLGGAVQTCTVTDCKVVPALGIGAVEYLAAEFTLVIHT